MRKTSQVEEVHAVVALVFNPELEVLSVTRGDDRNDLVLPGGYVEEGETPERAIVRELQEETGLLLTHARPFYAALVRDKVVETYFVSGYTGRLRGSPEGQPRWVTIDEFLAKNKSFRPYLLGLFHHAGMIQLRPVPGLKGALS